MEQEENLSYEQSQLNAFKLCMLIASQTIFFILLMYCLHPSDEPPKMRMRKLGTDFSRCLQTGETISPVTRLTVPEIALLCRQDSLSPCSERSYRLSEEEKKLMLVLKDGETNFLRDPSEMFKDPTMNYGSLIMKRANVDWGESGKEGKMENPVEAVVETLVPLKRTTKQIEKEKKKKKQERHDALNQLTKKESVERNNIFSRIMADRSRKAPKLPSTHREKTTDPTVEDADKTMQRKKLRPAKGFRNLVANETAPSVAKGVSEENNAVVAVAASMTTAAAMKKKKSVMVNTMDEQSLLQGMRTTEEPTAKKP